MSVVVTELDKAMNQAVLSEVANELLIAHAYIHNLTESMSRNSERRSVPCLTSECNGPVETLGGGTHKNGLSKYRYRCRKCGERWQQVPPHKCNGVDLGISKKQYKKYAMVQISSGLDLSKFVDHYEVFDPSRDCFGIGMKDMYEQLRSRGLIYGPRRFYASNFKSILLSRILEFRNNNTICGLGPRFVRGSSGTAKFIGVRLMNCENATRPVCKA